MTAKASLLASNAGFLAGALLGPILGWFGLAVGLTLGVMVDTVRTEFRLRAYLTKPSAGAPDEVIPGLIAALAIATTFAEGLPKAERRATLDGLLSAALGSKHLIMRIIHRPWPGSALAAVEEEGGFDASLLARRLALEGSAEARYFLAEAAWAFEARRGRLAWRRERELAARLADAGLGEEAILLARCRFFPEWVSPWEVLGLAPGSPRDAIRRAYRRVSKRWHPDGAGGADAEAGERFREARAAYELLSGDPSVLD